MWIAPANCGDDTFDLDQIGFVIDANAAVVAERQLRADH
jgi:hypothetical protein